MYTPYILIYLEVNPEYSEFCPLNYEKCFVKQIKTRSEKIEEQSHL